MAIGLEPAGTLRHSPGSVFRGEALPATAERDRWLSPQVEESPPGHAGAASGAGIGTMLRRAAGRDPDACENQRLERKRCLAVWPDQGRCEERVRGLAKKDKTGSREIVLGQRIDPRVGPDQPAPGTAGRAGAESLRVDQGRARRPGF